MDRLDRRQQNLDDAYAEPANFLEIEVRDPMTHGAGSSRYTEYTVVTRTNLPVFSKRECTVKRRYSDFEWLKTELQRDAKIVVPSIPKIFNATNAVQKRRRNIRTQFY